VPRGRFDPQRERQLTQTLLSAKVPQQATEGTPLG